MTLYQGVTLGGTGFETGKRHPTLEDNVTVGAARAARRDHRRRRREDRRGTPSSSTTLRRTTVVGNPGHAVRVDGKRPEGPDTDWIRPADPIADAIKGLSAWIGDVEHDLADLSGRERRPEGDARALREVRGPSPAGG